MTKKTRQMKQNFKDIVYKKRKKTTKKTKMKKKTGYRT